MQAREQAARRKLERMRQEHVLAFWDGLDAAARERLLTQVESLDPGVLDELASLVARPASDAAVPEFSPPDVVPLGEVRGSSARVARARERGAELLASGGVGYLLVAGGQASRLGFDGPKGAFAVGPVSGATLFEIFAHRLRAAHARYGATPTWYILTSEANDAATRAFFAEHDHFGLDRESVYFFRQGMLPALDARGRVLMARPGEIFFAPNGHGGVLSALATSGALAHARERGIDVFSYFQVDNPLARPADALFLGLHALGEAQMSTKVVRKRNAAEKVGVLGRVDGKLSCIEYSDLPPALREARTPAGELVYGAGNIAMHAIDRTFIERLTKHGLELPWHLARKAVPALDSAGRAAKVDGVKFEAFVFDALQSTTSSVILEVDRAEEFSPVKNAQGEDSPATARADLCKLHARWAKLAGRPLPPPNEEGMHAVEVDPLVAECDEDVVRDPHRFPEPVVTPKGHLYRSDVRANAAPPR